jgi:pimeloyl-ACP methyl ester carboxylesterase
VGSVYEQIGRQQDRERLPQIGRSVDIGGRSLNIFCSGAGSPAVVFESPGAGPGLIWEPIQTEIAKFTKACWYDRAGEGWSDPGPYPRTSAAIASDLHELLKRASVPPPFVLVGASFGGLNARVYNGRYPQEVAGMVLVDSSHEDEPERAPKFYLARTVPHYLWHPLHLLFRASVEIGLVRLTQPSTMKIVTHSDIIQALSKQPKSFLNNSAGMVMPESYAQGRAAGGLGDRPLIVLTAGKPMVLGNPEMDREAAVYQQIWIHEMQTKLARLSTRGRQIVFDNSDHAHIPPDAVIAAIGEIVKDIRVAPQLINRSSN